MPYYDPCGMGRSKNDKNIGTLAFFLKHISEVSNNSALKSVSAVFVTTVSFPTLQFFGPMHYDTRIFSVGRLFRHVWKRNAFQGQNREDCAKGVGYFLKSSVVKFCDSPRGWVICLKNVAVKFGSSIGRLCILILFK